MFAAEERKFATRTKPSKQLALTKSLPATKPVTVNVPVLADKPEETQQYESHEPSDTFITGVDIEEASIPTTATVPDTILPIVPHVVIERQSHSDPHKGDDIDPHPVFLLC